MKSPYLPPESDVNLTPSSSEEKDLSSPFSAKGRFGRLSYIAWNAILFISFLIIYEVITWSYIDKFNNDEIIFYIGVTVLLTIPPIIIMSFIFLIRRLHDMGISGWWSLLYFLPIVSILFMIYTLIKEGDVGSNRFAPPRTTTLWENIVGSIAAMLMIVFTIVAVIGMMI